MRVDFRGYSFEIEAQSENWREIGLTEITRSGTDRTLCKPTKGVAEAK